MKVLLAVHHFPPRYASGAELYTFRLARWLQAHGHEAEVICVERIDGSAPQGLEAYREDYEGVPVWRLNLGMGGAPFSWSYNHPLINAWLAEHLEQSRPDLLHLHSGYLLGAGVLEAAQAAGLPSVVTLHDYWFLCPRITLLRGDGTICAGVPADPAECAWCLQLSRRRYRVADQLSVGAAGTVWRNLAATEGRAEIRARREFLSRNLATASLVIAPSHFLAGQFAGLVAAERLRVVRLGMNISAQSARPQPQSSILRLGYIGQIAAHKGVHILARAVAHLSRQGRPVSLAIYGDLNQHPGSSERLRRQVAADERITLAGRFENSEVGAVLASLDALIVPSIWYENSPLSILEAQAAGVPVLTSALGGMAELVRDGVDGLHFRPGDASDLARQIQRLRDNPGLLEALQGGVRPPPTIDSELSTLAALYAQVAQGQSHASLEVA